MDWIKSSRTPGEDLANPQEGRDVHPPLRVEGLAKPSAIAAGEAKFCSRACYREWQKGKPKGDTKRRNSWNKGARGLKPNL